MFSITLTFLCLKSHDNALTGITWTMTALGFRNTHFAEVDSCHKTAWTGTDNRDTLFLLCVDIMHFLTYCSHNKRARYFSTILPVLRRPRDQKTRKRRNKGKKRQKTTIIIHFPPNLESNINYLKFTDPF